MPSNRLSIPAFLALLAGGMAIAFAGIFMRYADVGPVASAFWRMAIAAPLLWCWAIKTHDSDQASGKRTSFTPALAYAGLFFAADMGLWHLSLHYTSVSNATLLSNFAPIFIALWMWWAYKTRFARVFVIGMISALIGAVLLVGPNAGAGPDNIKLLGDGLGFITAIFYAGYQLVVKEARSQYSTARLMAWSTSVTACALLPFALLSSDPVWPSSMMGWLPLLALALVAQIGGQTVIAYASAHLPANLSSVSLLIQPLTATIAAWVLLHESIGLIQATGGVLLVWGIYLAKKGS